MKVRSGGLLLRTDSCAFGRRQVSKTKPSCFRAFAASHALRAFVQFNLSSWLAGILEQQGRRCPLTYCALQLGLRRARVQTGFISRLLAGARQVDRILAVPCPCRKHLYFIGAADRSAYLDVASAVPDLADVFVLIAIQVTLGQWKLLPSFVSQGIVADFPASRIRNAQSHVRRSHISALVSEIDLAHRVARLHFRGIRVVVNLDRVLSIEQGIIRSPLRDPSRGFQRQDRDCECQDQNKKIHNIFAAPQARRWELFHVPFCIT